MESGVDTTPVPPQSSYLAELWQTFSRFLLDLMARGFENLRWSPLVLAGLTLALTALAAGALAWLAVAFWRHRGARATA